MPMSSTEGKDWIVGRALRHLSGRPATILDVGVGCGTYLDLLGPILPLARWIGVEIWEPYVARFDLAARYDELIVADVRDLDPLPAADLIILGDVVEHMAHADALKLWDRARAAARRAVILSLPIVEYPQGEVDGNPYEAHVHTWTDRDVVADLPGIVASFRLPWAQTIGAYEAVPAGGV